MDDVTFPFVFLGLDNFLENLHGIYEIVVYTAEQGMTVFPIVDAIDTRNLINYKLVRDATLFLNGRHLKDLDKLNRDLSKVMDINNILSYVLSNFIHLGDHC